MKKEIGNLIVYDLELKVETPIFIGNGNVISGKEYIYNQDLNTIDVINIEKFFNFIKDQDVFSDFERFMNNRGNKVENFIQNHGGNRNTMLEISDYSLEVPEDLDNDIEKKRDIQQFIRNSNGQPYIPGSSLKGALRTAILTKLILDKKTIEGKYIDTDFVYENFINENYNDKLKKKALFPEEIFLSLTENDYSNKKIQNSNVDIMRGISISDSQPLSNEDLILAGKEDMYYDGEVELGFIIREALKPGTIIKTKLTIDKSIVKNYINESFINDAIKAQNNFLNSKIFNRNNFQIYEDDTYIPEGENYLLVGGGSGFFDKTLIYVLAPTISDGFDIVKNTFVNRLFKRNQHQYDKKITPRKRKFTQFNGDYYPFGYLKVNFIKNDSTV